MFEYHVQKGDTIADVSRRLNTNWKTLKDQNPNSVGRSNVNGNWFLKEGSTIHTDNSFEQSLQAAGKQQKPEVTASQPVIIPRTENKILFDIEPPPPTIPVADNQQAKTIEHTLQAGETLWELAVRKYHVHIEDIMAQNGITDPKALQIGQKLQIDLPQPTENEPVVASWYGEAFHGRPMANGDIYDMHAATIAHKEMPLGTKVELKNTETGEMVRAVVTDRGPYVDGRDVDLSYGLAQKLSIIGPGVGDLVMRVL